MADITVPSSPSPQWTSIIVAVLHIVLVILGSVGITVNGLTEADIPTLASAISLIAGIIWALIETIRKQQQIHAAAVVSAQAGSARMYLDYYSARKALKDAAA